MWSVQRYPLPDTLTFLNFLYFIEWVYDQEELESCSLLKRSHQARLCLHSLDRSLSYWWGLCGDGRPILCITLQAQPGGSCVYLHSSSRHSGHSWQTGGRYCQSALFLKLPTPLCVLCEFRGLPATWPAGGHFLPGCEHSWAPWRKDAQWLLLPWYYWLRQGPEWLPEKAGIVLVSSDLGSKVESGHRCGEKNMSL